MVLRIIKDHYYCLVFSYVVGGFEGKLFHMLKLYARLELQKDLDS